MPSLATGENRDLLLAFVRCRQVIRNWEPLGSAFDEDGLPRDPLNWNNMSIRYALTKLPDYIGMVARFCPDHAQDLVALFLAAKIYYIAHWHGRSSAVLWRLSVDT